MSSRNFEAYYAAGTNFNRTIWNISNYEGPLTYTIYNGGTFTFTDTANIQFRQYDNGGPSVYVDDVLIIGTAPTTP